MGTIEYTVEYLSILKKYIDSVKGEYDFILIDCPPTNNIITMAAFLMSDYLPCSYTDVPDKR